MDRSGDLPERAPRILKIRHLRAGFAGTAREATPCAGRFRSPDKVRTATNTGATESKFEWTRKRWGSASTRLSDRRSFPLSSGTVSMPMPGSICTGTNNVVRSARGRSQTPSSGRRDRMHIPGCPPVGSCPLPWPARGSTNGGRATAVTYTLIEHASQVPSSIPVVPAGAPDVSLQEHPSDCARHPPNGPRGRNRPRKSRIPKTLSTSSGPPPKPMAPSAVPAISVGSGVSAHCSHPSGCSSTSAACPPTAANPG